MRSSVCSTAAVSSANEVKDSGAASTRTVWAASGPITLAQLDPSAQAPCTRTTLTFSCGIGSLLVLRDQLIGNIVQVCTDDLRLRADTQDVVAHPLDQGSLPARNDGAKGVPG